MAKRKDNTARIRVGIGVGAAIVAAAVVALGLFYNGSAGEPYREVVGVDGEADRRGGDVRVVEYFSYSCPGCWNFERSLKDWLETLPPGVVFERVHVPLGSGRTLTRGYAALRLLRVLEANHERVFRAIHQRNRQFESAQALADFVHGYGVERSEFLEAMRSDRVLQEAASARRSFAALGLQGVPALVVDGKYVVNMERGRKEALSAARELAAELAAKRG